MKSSRILSDFGGIAIRPADNTAQMIMCVRVCVSRLIRQLEILHKDIYVDVIIFFPEKNRSETY